MFCLFLRTVSENSRILVTDGPLEKLWGGWTKSKKKFRQAKIKGKNIRAASCDIRQKVDKPQKKFLHHQFTGKKIQATQESPTPPITFPMVRP